MRQRMEQHQANPVCASCHVCGSARLCARESFEVWAVAAGVDASGTLPDGTKIDGPVGLRNMLLNKKDQFATTATERLLTYALEALNL